MIKIRIFLPAFLNKKSNLKKNETKKDEKLNVEKSISKK